MALLTTEQRWEAFSYLGLGDYNKTNIKKLQKKYLRAKDVDGIYGVNTDNLLRHLYNVKKYTKNFSPEEFKCECGGKYCTGYPSYMKAVQLRHIQKIRTMYGKPITVTCGLRCETYNSKLGGSIQQSLHRTGYATDFYQNGVTDTLANRKKAIKKIKKLPDHHYTYGNGINSYGYKIFATFMGNALHTDTSGSEPKIKVSDETKKLIAKNSQGKNSEKVSKTETPITAASATIVSGKRPEESDKKPLDPSITDIVNSGIPGYPGEFPSLKIKKSNEEVIKDAIAWAKHIAADNDFHYGHGKAAHHNGCYFCGTNTQKGGRAKTGVKEYEKSYCCNPFIGAAWAHGGCVPKALELCRKGTSWDFHKGKGYDSSSLFKNLGHPAKSKLKPGDVLCSDSHVAMVCSVDGKTIKIVHASGGDDNKEGSKKWDRSIRVQTLTDAQYKKFKRVHRYTKSVNTTANIRFGEYGKRVKLMQDFLKWYGYSIPDSEKKFFGDSTLKALNKFQKASGLKTYKSCGEGTIKAMKKAVKK